MSIRAYIADLAAYNEGKLIGEWLDLEGLDVDDIETAIQELLGRWSDEQGVKREEIAVHDWEGCNFGESPDWQDVVDYCEAVGEYGKDVVEAADACDIPMDKIQDAYCGEYENEEDYAYQWAEDTGMLSEVPENIKMYFDYAAFARDLFIDDVVGERVNGSLHVFNRNY